MAVFGGKWKRRTHVIKRVLVSWNEDGSLTRGLFPTTRKGDAAPTLGSTTLVSAQISKGCM